MFDWLLKEILGNFLPGTFLKSYIHNLSLTNFYITFPCHQGPVIYQFMKIQAGGVQSPLIAEQSVSSTSDLMSQESPFYSLTGTKPPLWLLLICANDIVFFIIYLLFFPSLFYVPHAK